MAYAVNERGKDTAARNGICNKEDGQVALVTLPWGYDEVEQTKECHQYVAARDNAACGPSSNPHWTNRAWQQHHRADVRVRGRDTVRGVNETRRCGCHGREKCLRREPLPRGNASLGSLPLPCSWEECEYAIAKVGDTASRDNSYRRVPVWSALIRHESHHTDCSRSCSYTIHAPMQPCRVPAVYICLFVCPVSSHQRAFLVTKPI